MNERNIPFILEPIGKDYLWGGTRLSNDFHLNIDVSPFAEAWVCSTHHDGVSMISSGKKLSELLLEHPDWLGSHALAATGGTPELPIMIKLIDAKDCLSVQVHPDDEYAKKAEGDRGKTEMWYVLAAKTGSEVIYGFKEDMTPERIRKTVSNGTIESCLNHIPVKAHDVFMVNPGIVHAIGAGCLIAEIQESSNITYRLYDYDRVDKNGNKRQLHIDKALDVARLERSTTPRQPMRVLRYRNGIMGELLARCKHFQTERLILNTENRKPAEFQTGKNSFHALLCVEGCGVIYGEGVRFLFYKGDCIFVPANSIELKMHGMAQLLDVSC